MVASTSTFSRGSLLILVAALLSTSCLASALTPGQGRGSITRRERAQLASGTDSNSGGYLGAFFLGADPYVYLYLSDGNNPVSFKPLNGGAPVLKPTAGTGGVRDPALVQGGGDEAGKKWYIVGTDLDIGKTSWDAAQRTGSRGIYIWDSTDLVNWSAERFAVVENETAGMVWAPEAIWDNDKGQYMVYWASKFYPSSDQYHRGSPTNTKIRYAYTSDFKTFSPAQTYIDRNPTNLIDLTILPLPAKGNSSQTILRFIKDETRKTVFVETSTTGLLGNWTRSGGPNAIIQSGVEGPAAYLDNDPASGGKVHLLLDFYGSDGYRPYESTKPGNNSAWVPSGRAGFPRNLRHGSVLPINQTLYDAVSAKWSGARPGFRPGA